MASTMAKVGSQGWRMSNWLRSLGCVAQASMKEEVQAWSRPNNHPHVLPMPSHKVMHHGDVRMVFLGPPGVGKGSMASRLANLIKVPHIAMGDLVRNEISQKTAMAEPMKKIMNSGQLLPNDVTFDLLSKYLVDGVSRGQSGFILDGLPRTITQAKILSEVANIDLAVNLRLREDVLVAKCLGRRTCSHCGSDFNVADVDIDGIRMPAILPPPSCASKLTTRADDTEEVVRARMRVFHNERRPVESFYRSQDMLLDFDVRGGISETWSQLLSALHLQDTKLLSNNVNRRLMTPLI